MESALFILLIGVLLYKTFGPIVFVILEFLVIVSGIILAANFIITKVITLGIEVYRRRKAAKWVKRILDGDKDLYIEALSTWYGVTYVIPNVEKIKEERKNK